MLTPVPPMYPFVDLPQITKVQPLAKVHRHRLMKRRLLPIAPILDEIL
jgi:hypothetical protein